MTFPPRCPLCDELADEHATACATCAMSLQRLDGDFIPVLLSRAWFSRARSALAYEGSLIDSIHGLKYQRRLDLVLFFVRLLETELSQFPRPDLLVPVPLHSRRLRQRGYNQAALLAIGLGKRLKIPTDLKTLKRMRHDLPQVGQEGAARLENVRGAFEVDLHHAEKLRDKRLLLIDDVMTTGATANECARVLMKAGAAMVDALTIARPL